MDGDAICVVLIQHVVQVLGAFVEMMNVSLFNVWVVCLQDLRLG